MKKQKIEKWEYILDSDEMDTVIRALQYTRHRVIRHPESGAKTIPLKKIENLLKAFDYKFSYKYEKSTNNIFK